MRRTAVPALLVVILLSGGIVESAPAVRGVALQSCERVNQFCVAKVINVSHKNVVALGMSLGGDPTKGISLQFFAGFYTPLLFPSEVETNPDRVFAPGTTKEMNMSIDPNAPNLLPVIDLVVYDDDTAEVGNEKAFQEVLKMRQEEVLTLEKELEILKRFASSENRLADTVAELKRVAAEVPTIREDDSPYPDRGKLEELALFLKRGWTDPQKATEETTKTLEAVKKHAHVTRITGDDL